MKRSHSYGSNSGLVRVVVPLQSHNTHTKHIRTKQLRLSEYIRHLYQFTFQVIWITNTCLKHPLKQDTQRKTNMNEKQKPKQRWIPSDFSIFILLSCVCVGVKVRPIKCISMWIFMLFKLIFFHFTAFLSYLRNLVEGLYNNEKNAIKQIDCLFKACGSWFLTAKDL